LAVGGQQGWVQLFDCHSRAVLRKFQTHRRAVRSVRFSPHSHGVIASASDDTTVRLWDVASGECATRFDGHVDYARSVAGHPASADAWASGGYDGTVRVWDARAPSGGDANGSNGARMVLDHGAPVEDVAWLPSGSLLVSVGGQECVPAPAASPAPPDPPARLPGRRPRGVRSRVRSPPIAMRASAPP
jgi:U3 small nucleolar RNA-associated protein 15